MPGSDSNPSAAEIAAYQRPPDRRLGGRLPRKTVRTSVANRADATPQMPTTGWKLMAIPARTPARKSVGR